MIRAIVVLLMLIAFPADAQQRRACAPAEKIMNLLAEKYGESRQSGGIIGSSNEKILVVFANKDTGTWTVLVLHAGGMACMLSSGRDWHDVRPAVEGEPT